MTGISLHMQGMASQLHGSILKENNWFFFITDQTPRPREWFQTTVTAPAHSFEAIPINVA
jgi:hypothetical protein